MPVNLLADALAFFARTALALVIALGLVALALHAARERVGAWLDGDLNAG